MRACAAITGDVFAHHDLPSHEESNARLEIARTGIPAGVRILPPEKATREDLERVHSRGHVEWLREMSLDTRFLDYNTYITGCSYRVALYAAGASIQAARMALEGVNTFALVRPPGHHAERDRAMGFCLLNNVAIAAAKALEEVDRVAIVDWDLHHGNGTQQIFYSSSKVLFCSVHQFNAFPFTGWVDEIGEGEGRGYTLNAPLEPRGTIGDYMAVFEQVFAPAIARFRPDLILISAGQDALADDPQGQMKLEPEDFGTLTQLVKEAGDCPLALVLEGGYGPSLGRAVSHIFAALCGDRVREVERALPRKSTDRVIDLLRRLWFI